MSNNLKLTFWGDFVSHSGNVELSSSLEHILNSSDLNCCNFEAPVFSNATPALKNGPNLHQSTKSPLFLENNKFNVISLSNNHMLDYGEEGYLKTVEQFSKNTLLVGAGNKKSAYKVEVIEIKGVRVGFLALCHREFGIVDSEDNDEKVGVSWINDKSVDEIITRAKTHINYLIILAHAGIEYLDIPLPEWRSRYKELIDLGADAVIASHPHVTQGWEDYKGKPIFYSLGNFYFEKSSSVDDSWLNSLMVEMNIDSSGQISYNVNNIKVSGHFVDLDNSPSIKEHNTYLKDLLSDDKVYMDFLNKESVNLWYDKYYREYAISINSIPHPKSFKGFLRSIYYYCFKSPSYTTLQNLIDCESHRWLVLHSIKAITNKSV